MIRRYSRFIRQIAVNRTAQLGVIITTSSFITFLFMEAMQIIGLITNAYIGLITYLLLPSLFVFGLILIPIAWFLYQRSDGRSIRHIMSERFEPDELESKPTGSPLFITIFLLTILNILFLSGAGLSGLHFMDSPAFCGTACHQVMNPEWTTYQHSPHARVKCVECHVGHGIQALIDSKINGTRQLILTMFDAYQRPIPVPVHQLRPSRETCEQCHWPEKFYGSRMKVITHYGSDEYSTPNFTTLNLKIDAGHTTDRSGIHWHIATGNMVRYSSLNDERQEMIWIDVEQSDHTFKRYRNKKMVSYSGTQTARTMDCVDCHNRATHIYEDPSRAVDDRISRGEIDRTLPFVKREVLTAITLNYPDVESGENSIAGHLSGFYHRHYPELENSRKSAIDEAIGTAQAIYTRNIHPDMKIQWGTYPGFHHHQNNSGCFRCHNDDLQDENGQTIHYDCTLCHSILAYHSDLPFKYLGKPDSSEPEYPMHLTLQHEFIGEETVNHQ